MTARSMMATRLRVFAAAMAPFWPAGPLPITTRSYSDTLNLRASNSQCQQHWFSPLPGRSEEHTSELQSRVDLVCRLLLEKKKKKIRQIIELKKQKRKINKKK